jgi:hypothetical protein
VLDAPDSSTNATGSGDDAGNTGSGIDDGGRLVDAAAPDAAQPDATPGGSGGTTDAGGPGGNANVLACGSTACAIPSQVCCVDRVGGGTASYQCVTGATCPVVDAGAGNNGDPPTALQCAGAANCGGGTVCCVQRTGGVTSSSCKASCGGQNAAQLCDPKAAAASSGCPADAGTLSQCLTRDIADWGLPATFATCGGVGN